jgi:hypothetical protein
MKTIAMLAVLLLPLAVHARQTPAKQKPAPTKNKAPAVLPDDDFGCTLDPAILKPWEAKGLRVPAASKGSFKLWKSVSKFEDLSASAKSNCRILPPAGAYVKGVGAGGSTRADLVVAQSDVTVYRAYSKSTFACSFDPAALEKGSWWALSPPDADKAAYRKKTAVCNTWNDFSMVVRCTLKKGTVVAVGSTQAANCTDKPKGCAALPKSWTPRFAASPEHQVFINTYKRSPADIDRFLLNCHSTTYE